MFNKFSHPIFFMALITGTMIACSSSSWFMAWVGLEINLMSVTPLLLIKLNSSHSEMVIKYFLTQAMASILIIFPFLISFSSIKLAMRPETFYLTSLALSMKAGMAPLHFWLPQVMDFANWLQTSILLTWQKIAPFILLTFSLNPLIYLMVFSSSIMGTIMAINQLSLKKILTFSSIIHSSWLVLVSFLKESFWWIYFSIYSVMVISMIMPAAQMDISFLSQINFLKVNYFNKIIILTPIMSLIGLPPFPGFFVKLMALNLFISSLLNPLVIGVMILSSVLAFYFYSRLIYPSLLMSNPKTKIFMPSCSSLNFTFLFTFISTSLGSIAPIMVLLS